MELSFSVGFFRTFLPELVESSHDSEKMADCFVKRVSSNFIPSLMIYIIVISLILSFSPQSLLSIPQSVINHHCSSVTNHRHQSSRFLWTVSFPRSCVSKLKASSSNIIMIFFVTFIFLFLFFLTIFDEFFFRQMNWNRYTLSTAKHDQLLMRYWIDQKPSTFGRYYITRCIYY